MDLFGANLMFKLNLLLFRQRVGLLFISKGERLDQMGLLLFPANSAPWEFSLSGSMQPKLV